MDQQLLLGILLIVVGIALGLIAAAVVVNRRIDAREQAEVEGGPDAESRPASAPGEGSEAQEQAESFPQPSPPGRPDSAAAESVAQAPHAAATAEDGPTDADAGDSSPSEPQSELEGAAEAPSPADTAPPAPQSDSLLGELHRDPVTGALFFRSSGQEFRSAADIDDRTMHDQLAGAAAEWSAWFEQAPRPAAAAPQRPPTSGMVQAIDAILQQSLENSGIASRGVRLIQDISGGVKVLIGVKSYEVDEVPDDEIRRLIREAVAEWEAHQ